MKPTFQPSERLGAYELLLRLGSGGMAAVILARHRGAGEFERLVVVKRVHRRHLANKDFLHMFRDEARLASSIRHPNVASVVDVVETEGELCLVMEYFEGLSLAALVEALGLAQEPMPPAVASRITSDALAGLHAAHEAVDMRRNHLGIVHRDVGPHNIIVDVAGISRVIDFGIAKAESRLTHTKSGFVKGKLGYMSPEQIEAWPLDRRTDLFSTGIVLYELVTGKRLFSGGDEFETMRRVLRGEIPDVSKVAPGVPERLDPVVRKALARAPDDRYATALEFQQALAHAVPPSPTPEVGALVSRLGAETLQRIRAELDAMLGLDVAKTSHGPPRLMGTVAGPVVPQSTRGKTLPIMPALGAVPARRAGAPRLVLAEADADFQEHEVGDVAGVPSRKSNVRLLALVLGLVTAALIVAYHAFSLPYLRR